VNGYKNRTKWLMAGQIIKIEGELTHLYSTNIWKYYSAFFVNSVMKFVANYNAVQEKAPESYLTWHNLGLSSSLINTMPGTLLR
jgi:hypothetical protein